MVALAACSWGTWRTILLAAEKLSPGLDPRVESAVVMFVMTVFAFAWLFFLGGSRGSQEPPFAEAGGATAKSAEGGARGANAPRTRPDPAHRPPTTSETRPDPAHGSPTTQRTTPDWLAVAWLGVADAMNVMLLFVAYTKTSVAIAVTTHYIAPLLVAVAAPLFLREHARGAWLAAVGGGAGLALLLRPWDGAIGRDALGAAAGAGSAFFYASNVLVNKRLVGKFTAIELMAYHGVFATPLLVAIAPIAGFRMLTPASVLVLIVGGIGPGALGGILFIRALRHVRASYASTLTLLEPLVAVGIAVLAFGEHLAPVSWVGAAVVLSCAAAVAYFGQPA